MGVEHWMICKGRKADTSIKLRIPWRKSGSQNVGAKLHVRKGNSPDHQLRSLNLVLYLTYTINLAERILDRFATREAKRALCTRATSNKEYG
ncbi:MAG: hypothetical protein A3B25_02780 [Candidatus Ryanbacteria bacterium RIFCSPLOWO2_01_FULL_48_26]|uniref:Uncharacterized protein n=1 Tax=Candidatus Ryanbacteria bacterium RIFCSPLOWO2_01_FULL_48_26 TaxID=1802126 RepID=A0A1G2GS10_9BACT|nr:MAG: hypothetical protein A3B25_02780 [Candidatus Ryanbacteria bacterium RIFCSPLOWO2_01_FULL_48_26]